MSETQVGIVVTAKDAATAVVRGVGAATKATASAFKIAGGATVVMNQALGLARKAWGAMKFAVLDTMAAAVKFRSAADPMSRWLKETQRESELVRARIGDALLPVMKGFSDAIGSVTGSLSGWIAQNRVLIGQQIIQWASSLASILANGIAGGVILAAKAWSGWGMLIDTTKLAVNAFFSLIASGVENVLGNFAALAEAVGAEGVGAALREAQGAAAGLGAEFDASAASSAAAIEENVATLDRLESGVRKVQRAVQEGIAKGAVNAHRELAASVAGGTRTVEELQKAEDRLSERKKLAAALERQALEGTMAIREANAARRLEMDQAQQAVDDEAMQRNAAIASGLTQAWGQAALAMAEGTQSATQAMLGAILTSVETAIMAYAAEAGAAALKAHSGIPFVGIALGTAAAGVAFGLARSYLSKLPKAAEGGLVTGGTPGRDSVPILAMPGERILNVKQTRAYDRGQRGGGDTFIVQNRSLVADTAQVRRDLRELERERSRLRLRGMVPA